MKMGKEYSFFLFHGILTSMPPLKNLRQETFCLEYVKGAAASRAYRAAGYSPKNANTCKSLASQLLTNINVKARVLELRQRIATRVEVSAARVLNELGRVAFSDVRKVVGENGAIVDPGKWDDDTAGAVAGIETEKLFEGKGKDREFIGYTQKLKLWDKNTALGNLAKHFKLLGDDAPKGDTFNIVNFYLPENARDVPNGHGTPTLVGTGNGHTD